MRDNPYSMFKRNPSNQQAPPKQLTTGCFKDNRLKTNFENNMRKPVQSAVVDTIGVDEMYTQDEHTLHHLQALISEESKDRNLLSPPDSDFK